MVRSMNRRNFLKYNAALLGGGAAALALGPRGLAVPQAFAATDLGAMVYRLGWVKNVEWSGSYFADKKGYWKDEGFSSVDLVPGGPNAAPGESIVNAGQALVTLSSPAITAAAVNQGAKLKIIGVQFQTSPFIIASPAAKPLKTPQDCIGKKIGVPGSNGPTWQAFLQANKIDPASLETVNIGFSSAPLTSGQVDGLMGFVTNVPGPLERQGFHTYYFGFGDFNFRLVNNDYLVTEDALKNRRAAVKGFLRGEIRGWHDALADINEAARLTVQEYGSDLGLDQQDQVDSLKLQVPLMVNDETKKSGLFTMTPALIAKSVELLKISGVDTTPDLFDMSVLQEIYAEDPKLI
jgi:ABC-type nitrate/sulfonate/bicarbonate transport system substrate-binding protein